MRQAAARRQWPGCPTGRRIGWPETGIELVLCLRGRTGFRVVLGACKIAADAAVMMLTPILLVVVVCRGRTGACTFACEHPAGAAPGVAGDDFFKEALLGWGRPEPAGSRPAGVFLQLKLNLVVSHPALRRGPGRESMNRGVVAAHLLL